MKNILIIAGSILLLTSCNKESVIEGYTTSKLKAPVAINQGTPLLTVGDTYLNYDIDGNPGRLLLAVRKQKAVTAGNLFALNDSISTICLYNQSGSNVSTKFVATYNGIDKLQLSSARKTIATNSDVGTFLFMGRRATPYTSGWNVLQALPPNIVQAGGNIFPNGVSYVSPQFTINETAYINFETLVPTTRITYYGWIKITTTSSRMDVIEYYYSKNPALKAGELK